VDKNRCKAVSLTAGPVGKRDGNGATAREAADVK